MSDIMPYKSTKYSDLNQSMLRSYEEEFKKVIIQAVEEFQPDVVICNHIWLLCTYIKDLYPDLKVLTLCHGTDLRQLERAIDLVDIVKKGVPRCEYLLGLNSAQTQEIQSLYDIDKNRVITSGSGYNPKTFFPLKKEKNEKIKIAYVGKICNYKGVPNLLNAVEGAQNSSNIELNLIGHGNVQESEDIIESIKTKKTEIHYLGAIPQEELAVFLKSCDIFILPSFFEGLPLVVIEAIASGAKVICTDLPGLDDFLGEELKELDAIRYIKMPRLKSVDTPFEEDIAAFEKELVMTIDKVSDEILEDKYYDIDKVIQSLEDKTWVGLFNRLEKLF